MSDADQNTPVDLGLDLLESTRSLAGIERPDGVDREPALAHTVENAKILQAEGFLEDAKKTLRRVLVQDPHDVSARQQLEEIHELELKQIFEHIPERRSPHSPRTPHAQPPIEDGEELLRGLDHDLRLGIYEPDFGLGGPEFELSLFGDRNALEKFSNSLEIEFANGSPRDRIDIGIAFLELGLGEMAARQFKAAARDEAYYLDATALLAQALLAAGRPFEARICLDPIIADSDVPREQKVEYIYWLGRSQEKLGHYDKALQCYFEVREIDSYYRDCIDRIRLLTRPR